MAPVEGLPFDYFPNAEGRLAPDWPKAAAPNAPELAFSAPKAEAGFLLEPF